MTFDRVPRPRARARFLIPALLASAVLMTALPGPAAAWILRYTTGGSFVPDPPVSTQPTTFLLYGYYPAGCGSVVSSTVLDAGHVAIHVRSDGTCPDSSTTEWI